MSDQLHIVLLGDSIFDNGAYVGGAPDVVRQLRALLPDRVRATLLAVDGAVTRDVHAQLRRLPADASLLVVSAGGNDALGEAHLLSQGCATVGEAIGRLAAAQARFRADYEELAAGVAGAGIPAALCTIYDANFPDPERPVITAALSLFNDVITRAAFRRGLALVDLRLICSEAADYANPIEPSARGGEKIAAAIARLADLPRAEPGASLVIAG